MRRRGGSASVSHPFWRDPAPGDTLRGDGFETADDDERAGPRGRDRCAGERGHLSLQARGWDAALHEHSGARSRLSARGAREQEVEACGRQQAEIERVERRPFEDPTRHSRYNGLIDEAAQLYELPESFIRAIMHVESNFNPTVVSRAGAMGLMQLMPQTAQSMGVSDPFDVRQNILGGARYLRILANRFKGDLVLTVAAYNAGEGAVEKYDGIPPYKETQRYVRRVLKHYYTYRGDSAP